MQFLPQKPLSHRISTNSLSTNIQNEQFRTVSCKNAVFQPFNSGCWLGSMLLDSPKSVQCSGGKFSDSTEFSVIYWLFLLGMWPSNWLSPPRTIARGTKPFWVHVEFWDWESLWIPVICFPATQFWCHELDTCLSQLGYRWKHSWMWKSCVKSGTSCVLWYGYQASILTNWSSV